MTLLSIEGEILDIIRDQISLREITQRSLAKAAGITQGHISQILASRKNAALPTLDRMRKAAGIEITASVTLRQHPQQEPASSPRPSPTNGRRRGRQQPASHPFRH